MKWLTLATLLGLLTATGCGTGVLGPDPRLLVNDDLRAVCGFADGNIRAIIIEVDALRQRGTDKFTALQFELSGCDRACKEGCAEQGPDCTPTILLNCQSICGPCAAAIVDQVYGQ